MQAELLKIKIVLDTETQLCYYPEQIYGGSFK
jgi:hypothetical protein